jgi:hypothetical protein
MRSRISSASPAENQRPPHCEAIAAARAAGTAGLTPAPVGNEPASFSLGPLVQPAFDVIEILPEHAAGLLRKLRLRSVDSHVIIPTFEDVHTANTAKLEAAA